MQEKKPKLSRFFLHCYFFLKKNFLFFFLALFVSSLVIVGQKSISFLNKLKIQPTDLLGFLGQPTTTLNNQNGVTNFLILGLRGEGVDSPDLTDSLVFISLNQNTNTISQIGIPRDLWVPSLQAKINTAYHYGEQNGLGAGIKLAEASISEILGQNVNYTIVVNFNLFKQVVDLVGGVDIHVSPGFEDKEFPLLGKENSFPISSRYETIIFPEGQNHLNGESALKFVRSRHSVGNEGTDFARSRRQQQIISALKDKIFNKDFLLSESKVNELTDLVQLNIKTNLPSSLYPVLARIGLNQSGKSIKTIPLGITPDIDGISILYNPPPHKYKGEWVLMPKDNNWKALSQYIDFHLNN